MIGYIILGIVYYIVSTVIFYGLFVRKTTFGLNTMGTIITMIPVVRVAFLIIFYLDI